MPVCMFLCVFLCFLQKKYINISINAYVNICVWCNIAGILNRIFLLTGSWIHVCSVNRAITQLNQCRTSYLLPLLHTESLAWESFRVCFQKANIQLKMKCVAKSTNWVTHPVSFNRICQWGVSCCNAFQEKSVVAYPILTLSGLILINVVQHCALLGKWQIKWTQNQHTWKWMDSEQVTLLKNEKSFENGKIWNYNHFQSWVIFFLESIC